MKKNDKTNDLKPYLDKVINSGLSQAQVARELGLSRASVNVVVKRRSTWMPSYTTGQKLFDLVERLGLTP